MTLRLTITATARPEGNGVNVAWAYPSPGPRPPVRVVRRSGRYPLDPHDGTVVGDDDTGHAADENLQGETVYYYGLFPHTGTPPDYDADPHNRASATATSPYDFAGQMYAALPAVYRRFDDPSGVLRRFLDLPGQELDRVYSLARMLLGAHDVDRVDGALLPLLADWIGWRTQFGLPLDKQRNEIRFAPQIYQTIGGLDALGSTVARVTGWPSRPKEYVHNVARTNQPERLNLWSLIRTGAGELTDPKVASVNFAYDGRPSVIRETDGGATVFYHTHRLHGWDIWAKRYDPEDGWGASEPIVDRLGIDKHPSATFGPDRVWLFWQSYDAAEGDQARWRIWYIQRGGDGKWTDPQVFGDEDTERMMPTSVKDADGGIWLFWRERADDGTWRVKFNRADATQRWVLDVNATFPLDGDADPRVEDDMAAMVHPSMPNAPMWLFWTRQEPGGPAGQTRRTIAYRTKRTNNPAVNDWSTIKTLPKDGVGAYHDRQPFPMAGAGATVDLLWSTTRGGGTTVVGSTLSGAGPSWAAPQTVVPGPFTGRGPAAIDLNGQRLIVYRSNRSLDYENGALQLSDSRYAGTTTVLASDTAKKDRRGEFDDFQTYTYDAGVRGRRTNDNRIARDTVGVFLTPDTDDPVQIAAAIARLDETLRDFMPVTARAVYIAPDPED